VSECDLVIRHGRVVTPAIDEVCDIGIRDGQVVQVGGAMEGSRTLDATGLLVLPGGVDAHVHLSNSPQDQGEHRWVDDFTSGTAAALAGGITTVGNMTFPAAGELPLASLERESAVARREAIGDVFLHPVIEEVRHATLEQIQRLRDAGCNSIKIFMVSEEFDRNAPGFVEATRLAGEAGMLTLFHCEDHALIGAARARLVEQGRTSIRHYPESAPVVSEAVATQRAVAIAELTGAPIYVVHVSSARALEVCDEAQARGVPVYVETRPLYLHLTRERFEEEEGQRYVGQPPLRDTADADALWAGLRSGAVHTVCSDHAPYSLAAKLDPAHTIEQLRAGVENLQTLRPMLYSEGVRTGRISLQRFVELTATNAARLFGLYPRKGTIAPGSDADLVLFDPNLTRTVEPAMLKSNADYSVFEGWEVTGWPVTTLSRGEIVFEHDRVIGSPGRGELQPRGATQML
jgi:dihydropyrimidinase